MLSSIDLYQPQRLAMMKHRSYAIAHCAHVVMLIFSLDSVESAALRINVRFLPELCLAGAAS